MFYSVAIYVLISQWRIVIGAVSPLMLQFGWNCSYDVRKLTYPIGWRSWGQKEEPKLKLDLDPKSENNQTLLRDSCVKLLIWKPSEPSCKLIAQVLHPNWKLSSQTCHLFLIFICFRDSSFVWFIVDISSIIHLLKRTWLPLARKGSQREGFSAN